MFLKMHMRISTPGGGGGAVLACLALTVCSSVFWFIFSFVLPTIYLMSIQLKQDSSAI